MASRNEYEMLFKLSAQLGQNFNGTFTSAQKTLAATQKEIQSLNKLQSDISSYTKQQQSIDAVRNKLSVYQQQLQNVQQEIAASGEYSSALANKELDLKQKIEQTEASLRAKTETLDRMGAELSEAGVDMSNLAGETQRLGREVDDLKEKQEKAAEEAENFGEVGANSAIAVGDALAAAGIATLLKEIYELYGDCVVGAASFGDEIGTVSVQYGIAAQDLQAYYYAAELVDVSVETLTSTMARNVRAMSYAQDGTARYVEAYEQLGVSVTNADGSLRDSEDVYWDVIDALGNMENSSERDAVAMELLGRSAQQINTLIAAGSDVMDEYAEMAEKAGYVMDEQMLASVMALDDELQIQNNNMTALKNTIGAQFAPEITAALKLWNNMLAGMTEFAEENPFVVKSLVALGLELATIVGIYGGYVAIKKTANAIKALNVALTAKQTVATGAQTAATVAQTTATNAATAAQTGLNVAMSSNPIGLILTAVSALTVGVIALTTAMSDAAKEEEEAAKELTAASQKHRQEIEALNAEYERTCELYGDTSYQAQELSWEIENLRAEYEESKQTMAEYREEFDESLSSYYAMVEEHEKAVEEVQKESASILSLVYRLDDLTQQTSVAASEQQEILAIIRALNTEVPGLSLSYDQLANKVSLSTDALMSLVQAEIASRQYEQYYENLVQKVSARSTLKTELETALENQAAALETYKAKVEEYNAFYEKHKHSVGTSTKRASQLGSLMAEVNDAATAYNEFTADVKQAQTAVDGNERAIGILTDMMAGLSGATDEAADSEDALALAANAVYKGYMTAAQAASYYKVSVTNLEPRVEALKEKSSALSSALKAVREGFMTADEAAKAFNITVESFGAYREITEITDEITALSEAYQDAYSEAYDSITGQYKLWDKAAEVIPQDIAEINTALETQTAYWHDYNADLQSLKERSADIEGLSDVIDDFADGSKESVNVIAGMAQASDEELAQMVANWQKLQTEQDGASESLATMNQDYATTLDELKDQLAQTIEDLNLEEEAKAAAEATMDAYIEALQKGADEAATIAQQLAMQVGASLNASSGDDAGGGAGGGDGGSGGGDTGGGSVPAVSQEEMIAVQIVKFGDASGSGMNAGKSGDNGIVSWGGKEYKVQNSGNAYGSSTPLYKAAVEVLGFGDRQIFGYNGKIYGYLDGHIQELEGRAMSSKGYDKLASDMSANYGTYHTGGLVGGVATLSAGEEFAKLLEGEFVSNPAQMKRFMEDTLPQVAEYGAENAAPVPVAEAQSSQGVIYTITIAPNFTLQGVESDNMEDKFRECGEMVVDMVIDRLEEMGVDAKRGAYV